MIRLTCASDFVEEAVLLAEPGMASAERRAFRRERDPLYEIRDPQARDERFCAFHLEWFGRLGLHRAVERIVAESLGPTPGVDEARLLRALSRQDEGADLVDHIVPGRSGTTPILVIRLRPAVALDSETTRAVLSHELMHVHDMLDPVFGYERSLPADAGALTETVLRDRYRVLWDATIDGRLTRAGRAAAGVRAARRREFEATFPMLGRGARVAFDSWFDRDRPTHDDLLAFARMPTPILQEVRHADTPEFA